MSRIVVRRLAAASALLALGTSPLYASQAVGAATPARAVAYGGGAYGSAASVGSLVHSGPTAWQPMCTRRAPYAHDNTTAAVSLRGLGTIGAVKSHVGSSRTSASQSALVSTYTGRTRLLGGLIALDAVRTNARVTLSGSAYRTVGTTKFVNLRIGGHTIAAGAPANKQITIAGIGTVVLNRQSRSANGAYHTMTVDALVLRLTATNLAHLPAGTVVVGHSAASLHTPTYRRAYGSAYATTVQVGSLVRSGRTAAVYLPCGGGNSPARSNSTATVQVPGLITTGATTSTARSSDGGATTTAATGSRITPVSLLGGQVKINALTTGAQVTRSGNHVQRSAVGTALACLVVDGIARSAPRLHSVRTLPGIGTLAIGRSVTTATGLQVYGIQLTLTRTIGTAPSGTVLAVGAAQAGVTTR